MPEEINRVVTDALSELLFVHSPEAIDNLTAEGIAPEKIHLVGNTMIDTLVAMQPRIDRSRCRRSSGSSGAPISSVTLHRPTLVDGPLLAGRDRGAASGRSRVARRVSGPPAHAREARGAGDRGGARKRPATARSMGYLEFLSLVQGAAGVVTDSGGIQEETTFLGIPCFTLRANTERPITCIVGTNTLLGLAPDRIAEVPRLLSRSTGRPAAVPELWDGAAAGRIVEVLAGFAPRSRPAAAA